MMEFMGRKFSTHNLGLNQTTDEGRYYAKVDGMKVGMDHRAFWETKADAEACARRFILATENSK